MSRHLEIAQSFVREQLQQRQGIIGILLVGSVAYGEETAFSDIDLRLIVDVEPGTELERAGIDGWRDGIYIDALPVDRADYTDLEQVLDHSIRANDLNSGLILYDPTGFLAAMQTATRAVFMAPERVAQRLQHLLERVPQNIRNLQQAIETHDPIRICIYTGRLVFGMALIPLIQQGIAPSSVRHLDQVGRLSAPLRAQFCELEGSAHLRVADILVLADINARLTAACQKAEWGNMPGYVVKKTTWMAQNGYPHAAVHAMWINCNFRANDALQSDDPQVIAAAQQLTQEWLQAVNWVGESILTQKLQMVDNLWAEIQSTATVHS